MINDEWRIKKIYRLLGGRLPNPYILDQLLSIASEKTEQKVKGEHGAGISVL